MISESFLLEELQETEPKKSVNEAKCFANELNKGSKIDLKPKGFRYHILESLILAQDERWRRA